MSATPDSEFLQFISNTPIDEAIAPDQLASALQAAPFVSIPGSLNMRDIGAFAPTYVRPKSVFRSGTLDFVPEARQSSLLTELGIATVIDFRRDDEVKQPRREIDRVSLYSCPYKDGTAVPAPTKLADFVPAPGEALGVGYRYMYEEILEGYTNGFRKVFDAIRTAGPNEAVLFHCTAGRDRTGVMAALILDLMGAPAELIGNEYALTRIGIDPFREKLVPVAIKSLEAPERRTAPLGLNSPGIQAFLNPSALVMVQFVEDLRAKHGGADGYLKDRLGFANHEIEEIKAKLQPKRIE